MTVTSWRAGLIPPLRCLGGLALSLFVFAAAPAYAQDSTTPAPLSAESPVELFVPKIINTYPHDTQSFIEGLVWDGGIFYESAGLEGASNVRRVDMTTGAVLQSVDDAPDVFGEGLALVGDKLYQLTWQEGEAYVYDSTSFEKLQTLSYEGEGWGLCYDGAQLWMSDGTETLRARDPLTFAVTQEVTVTLKGTPVSQLGTSTGVPLSLINELECVGDAVYANIWQTDYIVRIDKATGIVTGLIDTRLIITPEERAQLSSGSVLNGIAYNPDSDTFYITGKRWPKLFEVQWVYVKSL